MFSEMIITLRNNKFPKDNSIRGRLNIALIKKEAVLNLPPNFRVSDPKINPKAHHMIWASVLLKDKDLFEITSTIFLTEKSIESPNETIDIKKNEVFLKETLKQLLLLPSDKTRKESINNCIKKISIFNMLP